jgi:hypothetical protein
VTEKEQLACLFIKSRKKKKMLNERTKGGIPMLSLSPYGVNQKCAAGQPQVQ